MAICQEPEFASRLMHLVDHIVDRMVTLLVRAVRFGLDGNGCGLVCQAGDVDDVVNRGTAHAPE